jgi:hypothetical protein
MTPTRTVLLTPTPALTALGLGDKLQLNKPHTAKVDAPDRACQGASKVVLDVTLTAVSIERDSRQPTRVTIPYVRRIQRQQGIECAVTWLPDKDSVVLQITPLIGETYRVGVAGGTGLAVAQVDDIYGKDAPGTFVFDDVQLDVSRIELIQIKRGFRLDQENPEGELHRIQLVPR